MRSFCEIERKNLEARLRLLNDLEQGSINLLNADADIALFVSREKNVDETHCSSKAIELLDWDYNRRYYSRVDAYLPYS